MPEPLCAITVRQPWAWAIAAGHKPVENRSWTTSHRGPLAIHAGKTLDPAAERFISARLDPDLPLPPKWWLQPGTLPAGAIVALADLTGFCARRMGGARECACGSWAMAGAVHWRLARVRPLAEPVPCRGAQGLWTVPADVALQVGEAVDA